MESSPEYIDDADEDFFSEVIGDDDDFALERLADEDAQESEGEEDVLEEDEWQLPQRHRKSLVRNRLINSLDSCLDKANYDDHVLPNVRKEYEVIVEKPKRKTDKSKSIIWTNKEDRSAEKNTLPIAAHLLGDARTATSEINAWDLSITPDMIDDIVTLTNIKIQSIIAEITSRCAVLHPHIKVTDSIEIKSFLGLLYARGIFGQNKHNYKQLFMEEFGHPIFGAVMSVKRFGFLHASI